MAAVISQPQLFAASTRAATITLRPYQQEAIDAVVSMWNGGILSTLVVMPTGLGKTITFAGLLQQQLRPGMRALILAHRDELIQQPKDKLAQTWPAAYVGIVKAQHNNTTAPVICASVQTLCNAKRLAQLLAAGPIDILIIDEAHHATAKGYKDVVAGLRAANPALRLLGVTATPNRSDKRGLIEVFESVAYERDILWGIDNEFLVPLAGIAIDASLDLGGVGTAKGDYVEKQLAAALECHNWREVIYEAWGQHAANRPTLAFTVSVAMAESLCAHFQSHGVKAAWLSGETPELERRKLLDEYQRGQIQMICNCAVLTEGFDAPHTSCVIMARPTRSQSLWMQCIGRGTRLAKDKTNCLVLEFADQGHTAVQFTDLIGKKKVEGAAKQKLEVEGELDDLARQLILAGSDEEKTATGSPISRALNLLGGRRLNWHEAEKELSLTVDSGQSLMILPPQSDRAASRVARAEALQGGGQVLGERALLVLEHLRKSVSDWQLYLLNGKTVQVLQYGSLARMVVAGEHYAKNHGAKWAVSGTSRFNTEPATLSQVQFIKTLGVAAPDGLSKSQASTYIGHILGRRNLVEQKLYSE